MDWLRFIHVVIVIFRLVCGDASKRVPTPSRLQNGTKFRRKVILFSLHLPNLKCYIVLLWQWSIEQHWWVSNILAVMGEMQEGWCLGIGWDGRGGTYFFEHQRLLKAHFLCDWSIRHKWLLILGRMECSSIELGRMTLTVSDNFY